VSVPPSPIRIAVAGYGYWGPNIVRNVLERPEFQLAALCEVNEARAAEFRRRYPGVPVEHDIDSLLANGRVDAVAIATPPTSHYELGRRALEAGKHVLIEKPLARTSEDAVELIALAEDVGVTLMPGHTFIYSPPVNRIRELIQDGTVGDPYFITSSRMNLGLYQLDGVVCDLAPHDLSILMYWLEEPVVQIAASGRGMFRDDVVETAFLTLTFAGGTTANLQISWLAPRKVREMVLVGSKRMIQYDDSAGDESVRVYDRGFDVAQPEPANFGEYRLTYRTGDMVAPRIDAVEPLNLELKDFAMAILAGEQPRSNARLGLDIVLAVEAAEASLEQGGAPVPVALASEVVSVS
jgi:predicted dehydrogenase